MINDDNDVLQIVTAKMILIVVLIRLAKGSFST